MLSSGHTIYNGPVSRIDSYFAALGAPIPEYTNPADFLIRVAIEPKLGGLQYSTGRLAKECKDTYVHLVKKLKDEENFNVNLT